MQIGDPEMEGRKYVGWRYWVTCDVFLFASLFLRVPVFITKEFEDRGVLSTDIYTGGVWSVTCDEVRHRVIFIETLVELIRMREG